MRDCHMRSKKLAKYFTTSDVKVLDKPRISRMRNHGHSRRPSGILIYRIPEALVRGALRAQEICLQRQISVQQCQELMFLSTFKNKYVFDESIKDFACIQTRKTNSFSGTKIQRIFVSPEQTSAYAEVNARTF